MGPLKRLEQGLSLLRAIAQTEAVKDARDRVLQRLADHASRVAQSDLVPKAIAAPAEILAELIGKRPPVTQDAAPIEASLEPAYQDEAAPRSARSVPPPAPGRSVPPPAPGRSVPPPAPGRSVPPPASTRPVPPAAEATDQAEPALAASPATSATAPEPASPPAPASSPTPKPKVRKARGRKAASASPSAKTAANKRSTGTNGRSTTKDKKVRDKPGDLG